MTTGGMQAIKVFDPAAKGFSALSLDVAIDTKKLSAVTYARAVRSLMQSWRQGTCAVKTRSEVSFSRKKPWKQKGTGRARAGSKRSPLWRKGGVMFGPQPRVRELTVNKKQKKSLFGAVFSAIMGRNEIYCLDFSVPTASRLKTKNMVDCLSKMGVNAGKVLFFVQFENSAVVDALRNVPWVTITGFDQPNIYDLSSHDHWVFLKQDSDLFKTMVQQWN